MKHPKEEALIAYHDGEVEGRATITAHLADCPECQAELAHIDALLAAINSIPVPEPAEDYGQQVWQQISPRLPEKRAHWWDFLFSEPKTVGWLAPRRLVAAGAIATLVLAAFIAGRLSKPVVPGTPVAVDQSKVRERILVLAVGEHLGRSEMVLVELANSSPQSAGQKESNISRNHRPPQPHSDETPLFPHTPLEP